MCGIDVDAEGNDWDDEAPGDKRDGDEGGKGKGKAKENKSPSSEENCQIAASSTAGALGPSGFFGTLGLTKILTDENMTPFLFEMSIDA